MEKVNCKIRPVQVTSENTIFQRLSSTRHKVASYGIFFYCFPPFTRQILSSPSDRHGHLRPYLWAYMHLEKHPLRKRLRALTTSPNMGFSVILQTQSKRVQGPLRIIKVLQNKQTINVNFGINNKR